MKRVSITLSNDLQVAVEDFVSAQKAKPSLAAVVQAALRQFLVGEGYLRTPQRLAPPGDSSNGAKRRAANR